MVSKEDPAVLVVTEEDAAISLMSVTDPAVLVGSEDNSTVSVLYVEVTTVSMEDTGFLFKRLPLYGGG